MNAHDRKRDAALRAMTVEELRAIIRDVNGRPSTVAAAEAELTRRKVL
jgi:hypothetical protein